MTQARIEPLLYFDLNAEAVFGICKNHLPAMTPVVKAMIEALDSVQQTETI